MVSKGTQYLWYLRYIYRPLTKFREGYVFTGVCDSVHRGGGAWSRGAGLVPGGTCSGVVPSPGGGAWWRPPRMATAAGGTHPTGMHSC